MTVFYTKEEERKKRIFLIFRYVEARGLELRWTTVLPVEVPASLLYPGLIRSQ